MHIIRPVLVAMYTCCVCVCVCVIMYMGRERVAGGAPYHSILSNSLFNSSVSSVFTVSFSLSYYTVSKEVFPLILPQTPFAQLPRIISSCHLFFPSKTQVNSNMTPEELGGGYHALSSAPPFPTFSTSPVCFPLLYDQAGNKYFLEHLLLAYYGNMFDKYGTVIISFVFSLFSLQDSYE